jgi:hypothetical protein
VSGVEETKLVIDPEKSRKDRDFTMKSFGINSLLLAYLGGDPPATFFFRCQALQNVRPVRGFSGEEAMMERQGADRGVNFIHKVVPL